MWQWVSKGDLLRANNEFQFYNNQLHLLSGIGELRSTHQHADVKVYINDDLIDFSEKKYQITTSFIHFEEGLGDVIHTHATGLTLGHMFNSLNMNFTGDCIILEETSYCNDGDKKLKFFVNGKLNKEFDNKVIGDLDKYLISYGDESEAEIQKQLDSLTNLAIDYSAGRYS
ncbi:hypothetical protein CMO83_01060 [Candidatus Woesearchaeota archaeon]|nr:hypothetical protein [Candidatus Woesearchaeota archaeon]